MVCPNDDPYFTRMMYRMGFLKRGMSARELVERRCLVYYSVCIVVRAALIVTVYHWRNVRFIQLLVLIGALMGINNLWRRNGGTQWWSKKFQLVMSILIAVLVVLVFFRVVEPLLIPAAMAVSLAAGILQSFVVGFC
jgi:D-alanyl-lipoteichoic acid acyltransferase DltB (MBOAT superfamily)